MAVTNPMICNRQPHQRPVCSNAVSALARCAAAFHELSATKAHQESVEDREEGCGKGVDDLSQRRQPPGTARSRLSTAHPVVRRRVCQYQRTAHSKP
eukprot:1721079-Rhodomonas_salina.1